MQNENRQIDKTHLSVNNAEERGFLHRDYIAHCLRWSHIVKHLQTKRKYQDARIIDIGCGKETPLIKTLYTMKMTPYSYIGVDMNEIREKTIHGSIRKKMGEKFELWTGHDFSSPTPLPDDMEVPTLITCFEVLEHVTPEKVLGILQNIQTVSDNATDIFISTPCFNGKAAANHINEMTYGFMENLMSEHFQIIDKWGTFASQRDIEPELEEMSPEIMDVYNELKSYYDSNLLSVIFAPLFPEYSRNAMWHVRLKDA